MITQVLSFTSILQKLQKFSKLSGRPLDISDQAVSCSGLDNTALSHLNAVF